MARTPEAKREKLKESALRTMDILKLTLRSIVLTLHTKDVGLKILKITNAFELLRETIEEL